MLIIQDEVVTGAIVNAIAVVGRQIRGATSGLRKPGGDLETARWFETFHLTGTVPNLPEVSRGSGDRLTAILDGDAVQAALQELLAARLTDAPETDASRARDAVRATLSAAGPDTAGFAKALADYYDEQICALVARLEGEEPPLLAQIRSEAFSSRIISALHAIERHTAALSSNERRPDECRLVGGRPGDGLVGVQAGRLLAEVTDPFSLEVHRPVQADNPPPGLPVLPVYVLRDHDLQLAEVVQATADGSSGIAVLVGGSSTGKTRACWEALRLLRERPEGWRLWHPIDPSRPEAALLELPSIGPRTVVWLNEAQFYLDAPADGLGEQIAAGLRELLYDPARAPVLILATLWPQFWDALTSRPGAGEDRHAQARELLTGREDISVPAAFTADQLQQLAGAGDPRLAWAAEAAEGGQVIQFVAGVPELMARYRNAPPTAAALISAAMDARRLGMGVALPLAFLEAAAPSYLTDTDWDGLGEDWLEQALAYTAAPCKGIRGPLTRIRPRSIRSADPAHGPGYRLADYLEQHGGYARRRHIPPADFWDAAVRFADPGDLPALAIAAENRGLLRDAARLRRRATAHGDTSEAAVFIERWHSVHPDSADPNPARWAAVHASLAIPYDVAGLLYALRKAGAAEQAKALAVRAAAHPALDDPRAVAWALDALRDTGAEEQLAALLARDPAAYTPLDNPGAVSALVVALQTAEADEQARALAGRAAADASLDDPSFVAWLLRVLRDTGAEEQVAALLGRKPASFASLNDPEAVASLLHVLLEAGAAEQARALAVRAAAHGAFGDPFVMALLLYDLREADADEPARVLADLAAAHAALDDPEAVARLLDALREAGAEEQVAVLAGRAAAHAALDDPEAVARLLDLLREARAEEQVATLLARDPAAHAAVDDPNSVAELLGFLREAGATEQARALAGRAAAYAALDDPRAAAELLDAMRKAGAEEQVAALLARGPAAHAALDDPRAAAKLLDAMRKAGAEEQVVALAGRAAANIALDDPCNVADLLDALREAGAEKQVAALLARGPAAHTDVDEPRAVARLLYSLREAGAAEQAKALAGRAAARTSVDDPEAVRWLLVDLRKSGAEEQAATLAGHAAANAALDHPRVVTRLVDILLEVGAAEQAAALAGRAAAHAAVDHAGSVTDLLYALREAGKTEQAWGLADRAAARVALDTPSAVDWLLMVLKEAGAAEQATTLANRLPADGQFNLFCKQADHRVRYRFGREPNGSPAPPWGWEDLD
jgi:uncharacterized protein YidB (DUF937 family)